VLLTISEIILQSSVALLADKHNDLDVVYLVFIRNYTFRLSTSTIIGQGIGLLFCEPVPYLMVVDVDRQNKQ